MNKILITIIFTMLFLVGCTSTTTPQKFNVGTEGLVIEFAKSNPGSIYEGEEFGTALFVKNIGSYTIPSDNPAILKISYDDYRVSMVRGNANETEMRGIHGKSIEYPVGEEAPVETYFQSKPLTHLREGATTYINYNLCYPYMTNLTTMTCIDTKIANRDESAAACASEDYNGAAGQGAPIVITKIVPEIMLQTDYVRPQFKIYVENRGKGYVTSSQKCEGGATNINDRTTSGFVNVRAELPGLRLECGPDNSGVLRLVDSESFIRCYLPANINRYARDKKNYITPLTISLSYTYVLIEEQKVEIKRDDTREEEPTQGLCNTYEVEYDDRCITKCEYCSNHSSNAMCQDNKPYAGFSFGENFSCTCNLQQCNDKLEKGSCIKGYCPGDRYCCSSVQCDAYQVEFGGTCINKCEYCASHPRDVMTCTSYNFSGFRCQTMDYAKCSEYSAYGACIFGYCGGANMDTMYCANDNKIRQILLNTTGNPVGGAYLTVLNEATSQNLCAYCAAQDLSQASEDERCTFYNNGVIARVDGSFGCTCDIEDEKILENYKFVPQQNFCDNDAYCCSTG